MLALTPCDLFPLIRGRTVWLVGDSIMQEFMKAVQCFFVEFLPDDLENVPLEFLTPDRAILERLEGGWCAALLEDTRLCHLRWCGPPPPDGAHCAAVTVLRPWLERCQKVGAWLWIACFAPSGHHGWQMPSGGTSFGSKQRRCSIKPDDLHR